jgi:RimJ/RimL family protein N-acetyltransferase
MVRRSTDRLPEQHMTERVHLNHLAQPVGIPLPNWTARPRPPRTRMAGRYCRVEPLDPARHGAALYAANSADGDGRMWTYLSVGPFADEASYRAWLEQVAPEEDPHFHAIVDTREGKAVGLAAYMRIDPGNGVIEVGHLHFSPSLQRTPAATEAMYLMMRRGFDELGYRRYEWKCDSLNARSRAAAERYGFQFEGLFRQAVVYKGRSRDTAWYSIVDTEWPAVKNAFERWLDPANFDATGRQRARLSDLRELHVLGSRTPGQRTVALMRDAMVPD